MGKKSIVAHKAAYLLLRGAIEDGKILMHTCDFPRCVNPDHLKVGTHSENMQDMVAKGRDNGPKGVANGCSKYTDADVLQIKLWLSEGKTVKEVAQHFNVTFQSVYQIGRCQSWQHIAPELGQTIKQRLFVTTPDRIDEIHRLKNEVGLTQSQIADRLGMWQATVSKILRRKREVANA